MKILLDWMGEHPILTVVILIILADSIASIFHVGCH